MHGEHFSLVVIIFRTSVPLQCSPPPSSFAAKLGNQTGRSRGKLIGQLEEKEGKSLVPALLSAEVRIVER